MLEQQNLDTQKVYSILENLDLTPEQRQVVAQSFRTRGKWVEGILDFQFKYLEEGLDETQKKFIESTVVDIGTKLSAYFKDQKVTASCKIGVCCRQDCFCCTEYPKHKL